MKWETSFDKVSAVLSDNGSKIVAACRCIYTSSEVKDNEDTE